MTVKNISVYKLNCNEYDQYRGIVTFISESFGFISIEIEDTSCGDMGTRETVAIKLDDISVSYTTGSMEDSSIMSVEEIQRLLSRLPKVENHNVFDVVCWASNIISDVYYTHLSIWASDKSCGFNRFAEL